MKKNTFLVNIGLLTLSMFLLFVTNKSSAQERDLNERFWGFVVDVIDPYDKNRTFGTKVNDFIWGDPVDNSSLPKVQRGLGEDRPGYHSEVTRVSQHFYYHIMDKMMRGEELNWAENLTVGYLIANRRWPDAPDITEKDRSIQKWIDTHPDYKDAIAGHIAGEMQAIGGKFDQDLPLTPKLKKFRRLYYRTPSDQRTTVMNTLMNWYRMQGFDMRSDEAKEESKKRAEKSQQRKIRQIRNKQIAEAAKKLNVHKTDLEKFYHCVCRRSGGSMGGYYDPGKGGPCKAWGALSSWQAPMPISKKVILGCRNQIDWDHYVNDQKIFAEMHKNDELVYKKLKITVQEENAKSVAEILKEIVDLIKTQRQAWKEEALKAASLFNPIKSLLLDKDKAYIRSILTPRLRNVAHEKMMEGNLGSAIKTLEIARTIGDHEKRIDLDITQYKKWQKSWNEVVTKTLPKISQDIDQGRIVTANKKLEQTRYKMSTQGGNLLPPINSHPKLLAIQDALTKKTDHINKVIYETRIQARKYEINSNPKMAIELIDKIPSEWELDNSELKKLRAEAVRKIHFAKESAIAGDNYKKKKDYSFAIDKYQTSLNLQKDSLVQQKLDELTKQIAVEQEKLKKEKRDRLAQKARDILSQAKKRENERKVARWISVPNLSGKSLFDVRSILKSLGFRLKVEKSGSAPSAQLSGKVKSQRPLAGFAVKKGSVVAIKIYSQYIEQQISVSDLQAKYIGCYKEKGHKKRAVPSMGDRDINSHNFRSNKMTIELCTKSCAEMGFDYAGTQYASECFCDNSYGKYGKANNCNMLCTGNKNEVCGGEWANSVYALTTKISVKDNAPIKTSTSKITSPIKAKYGPPPSANKWKRYSIPLTASSFGINKQIFRQVMSNISSFRIATEMHDGEDIGSIDSVHIGNRYISDFSTGADGWNAAGDGTMHWLSSGGSSGGYLQISDWASGEEHYAVAPASWSGNWEGLIGSNIEFYYKTDHPSYSAVVEISSKQQNRLGLIAKPIIIPQGGSTLISISPYPVSSTDLVISLSSSNTNCSEIQNSVVIPAGKKNIETKVNAIQGATDCDSVITATTSTYGESRITLSVGKKASNSPIDTGDTGKSSVITSGITKTSTNYTPNTKGDVFKGGHWAGASGQSDWIQKDFGSVRLVTGIYIGRASTDITTQGFKLVLKLQQTNGQWITIDELHNTNINRTALSGGAIGKSIPPYSKKLSPAIKATAFRLEFSGHGWFDATDIRIYSQQENSIGFTLGFETGKTNGWVKTGTAFDYQPTYGDNPTARHRGQPSKHIGNYWIGTYEKYQGCVTERPGSIQGDGPKGTLTSKKFTIPSGSLSFLVGGGSSFQTRVELLVSGNKVLHVSGKNTESMHRVEWNLTPWAGQKGQIKVVDNASGGWGHINVDDFKFSGSTWFTEK